MPRKDLVQFVLAPQHEPGLSGTTLKTLQVVPALPSPMSEFLKQAFAELQLKCGLSLAESRKHPYERAALAEQILELLEKHYIENAVRSEALSNFVTMRLLTLLGYNKVIGEATWKKITIAAYWKEDEDAMGDEVRIEIVRQPQQKIKTVGHKPESEGQPPEVVEQEQPEPEVEATVLREPAGLDELDVCSRCNDRVPIGSCDAEGHLCTACVAREQQGICANCRTTQNELIFGYCAACKERLDAGKITEGDSEIITVQSDG